MDPEWKLETLLTHFAEDRAAFQGAVVPPLFKNSLFTFESWEAIDRAFDDRANTPIYSRGYNPTVGMTEAKLAKVVGGERAKLFGSGMAAIAAAVLHCNRRHAPLYGHGMPCPYGGGIAPCPFVRA